MKEVKNVKFSLIDSVNPNYVEVVATYTFNGKLEHHYMFLTKIANYKKQDYLREAKVHFEIDNKNDQLTKNPGASFTKRGTIVVTSILAACTIALGSFLTYKLINDKPGGGTEGDIVINFDTTTADNMSIYPATADKEKDYEGVITLKEKECVINLDNVVVTIDKKELVKDVDYTFELKGLNKDNKYEYNLKINAECMVGNITITAESVNVSKYQVTNDVLKDVFKNVKKVKTVNKGIDSNGSLDSTSYYSPTIQRHINVNSVTCANVDRYIAVDSTTSTTYDYTNRGKGRFYEKSLYVGEMPSIGENDICADITKIILPMERLKIGSSENDLRFDPTTLSYTCPEQTIVFRAGIFITIKQLDLSFYNNQITGVTVNEESSLARQNVIEGNTKYIYDFEDLTVPSDDICYLEGTITNQYDERGNWPTMLNRLKNLSDIYYDNVLITPSFDNDIWDSTSTTFSGNKIRFSTPEDYYKYNYIETTDDNNHYLYEKKDDGKWGKKRISDDEYEKYNSKKAFNNLIDFLLPKLDNLEFDGYQYRFTIDNVNYGVGFNVCSNISGTDKDVYIFQIFEEHDLDNYARVYDNIVSYSDFNIVLPTVE